MTASSKRMPPVIIGCLGGGGIILSATGDPLHALTGLGLACVVGLVVLWTR